MLACTAQDVASNMYRCIVFYTFCPLYHMYDQMQTNMPCLSTSLHGQRLGRSTWRTLQHKVSAAESSLSFRVLVWNNHLASVFVHRPFPLIAFLALLAQGIQFSFCGILVSILIEVHQHIADLVVKTCKVSQVDVITSWIIHKCLASDFQTKTKLQSTTISVGKPV